MVISAVSDHGIGVTRVFQGKSVAVTLASLGMALNALATATYKPCRRRHFNVKTAAIADP